MRSSGLSITTDDNMARVQYREIAFKAASLERIQQMQGIVAEYARQGLRLTARQLYYQFVARDLIPNTVQSYKRLTSLLADARYAGMVDWDAIEDRGREPVVPSEWNSIQSLVRSAIRSYRLPRWADQPRYVELWVEKQALAGVLEPLAQEFHVVLSVNKGYSSASAMYGAAQRFNSDGADKDCLLFYLGDHDPSGEDMVRDIRDRLVEFEVENLTVTKLALTMDQVEEYDPPPNPAKTTDSRYAAYAEQHGDQSWEVDALPPDILQRLIRGALEEAVDQEAMDAVIARENRGKAELQRLAGGIRDDVGDDSDLDEAEEEEEEEEETDEEE